MTTVANTPKQQGGKIFAEVVIAVHDPNRPIGRAVRSVLADKAIQPFVRVTVVCHGIPAEAITPQLSDITGNIRLEPFADGIASPAGPYNHGLSLADAEYVSIMGSDDWLEPGAMASWIHYTQTEHPDVALAPLRLEGDPVMPNPLTRPWRSQRLDPVKDRLFYRTTPLGLLRVARIRELNLRLEPGLATGEDLIFGVKVLTKAGRVDYLRGLPCYVIGQDADERTSTKPRPLTQSLECVERLLADRVFINTMPPRQKQALAVKLLRVNLLGFVQGRPLASDWTTADIAYLAGLVLKISRLNNNASFDSTHPNERVLSVFSRADRELIDALLAIPPNPTHVASAVTNPKRRLRRARWLTPGLGLSFGRESTLRRYALYFINRFPFFGNSRIKINNKKIKTDKLMGDSHSPQE